MEITPLNPHGSGRYLPALDGWRGLAILLVMVFHGLHTTTVVSSSRLFEIAQNVSGHVGAFGVLIFFAISGFLITLRLFQESGGKDRISLRAFFAKRAFRILPAMLVYLVALVLLQAAHAIQLERNDWFATIFLTNYLPGSWYTRHFWSLSVEEHFYLLWPLCILIAGWRRSLWIGIALIGVVGVWRGYKLAHLGLKASDARFDEVRGLFLSHTDARLDYIMAGCVLALLLVLYPGSARVLVRCGSGLGLLCLLALLGLSAGLRRFDLHTAQAVLIALIVVGTSFRPSSLGRVLSHPAMLFTGKISYSLYLWQQLFLAPTHRAFLHSPAALPVKFAGAFAVAFLSYRLVERPMIHLGRSL